MKKWFSVILVFFFIENANNKKYENLDLILQNEANKANGIEIDLFKIDIEGDGKLSNEIDSSIFIITIISIIIIIIFFLNV